MKITIYKAFDDQGRFIGTIPRLSPLQIGEMVVDEFGVYWLIQKIEKLKISLIPVVTKSSRQWRSP